MYGRPDSGSHHRAGEAKNGEPWTAPPVSQEHFLSDGPLKSEVARRGQPKVSQKPEQTECLPDP